MRLVLTRCRLSASACSSGCQEYFLLPLYVQPTLFLFHSTIALLSLILTFSILRQREHFWRCSVRASHGRQSARRRIVVYFNGVVFYLRLLLGMRWSRLCF